MLSCPIFYLRLRVAKMVSAMQGQLLSVCVSQMDDLEKTVNSLGPLSDGYDTLAKDADQISVSFSSWPTTHS